MTQKEINALMRSIGAKITNLKWEEEFIEYIEIQEDGGETIEKAIENLTIPLDVVSEGRQKGLLRLSCGYLPEIKSFDDLQINCIITCQKDGLEMMSLIPIESLDMFHDIQNIKEQIHDINPMHIYDMQGNELWNCFDCFDL